MSTPEAHHSVAGYGQWWRGGDFAPLRRRAHPRQRSEAGHHAGGLPFPYMLDGVTYSYTPDDYTPMKDPLSLQRQGLGYFGQARDGVETGARCALSLSPLLRGEGRGEGLSPRHRCPPIVRYPLTRIAPQSDLSPQAGRGKAPLDEPALTAYLSAVPSPNSPLTLLKRCAAACRFRRCSPRAAVAVEHQLALLAKASTTLGAADRAPPAPANAGGFPPTLGTSSPTPQRGLRKISSTRPSVDAPVAPHL